VNAILHIPIELRLLGLAMIGAWLGSLLNLAIYRLAYAPRSISPWSAPLASAARRRWSDWLPIVGWFGLRRESRLHGSGFWVRPMLVELFAGLGLAALYWWEVRLEAILPEALIAHLAQPGALAAIERRAAILALHRVFIAHAVLIGFMVVASLIDVDERLIPDEVTVPGTLLGLLLAAYLPTSLLPIMHRAPIVGLGFGPPELRFLTCTSTDDWPRWLDELKGLAVGLGCVWLWCIGLMPRSWRTRHGFRRAWAILWARLLRDRLTLWALAIGLAVSIGIVVTWRIGGDPWRALLSSLIGMAVGGGLIWIVRIIGKAVLGREAMGFGDVTLLAMIGSFLGWHACLVIFFLAPIAGAAIGIAQLLMRRQNEIRYGPFLCLAALVTIVRWSTIWESLGDVFALGWLIPATMAGCLLLMVPLLFLVRLVGNLFRR
jgi:prepilin signal peptidase PulO-like enzyme (type II secretory pathway)